MSFLNPASDEQISNATKVDINALDRFVLKGKCNSVWRTIRTGPSEQGLSLYDMPDSELKEFSQEGFSQLQVVDTKSRQTCSEIDLGSFRRQQVLKNAIIAAPIVLAACGVLAYLATAVL
jgi:hypothetical protein